jgi:hypothetical protein
MQKMESLFLKNQGALKDLYSIKEGLNFLDLHVLFFISDRKNENSNDFKIFMHTNFNLI